MSRDLRLYLNDIVSAAEKIRHYTDGMDQDQWQADGLAYDAVMHNLMVVGEAAARLPGEFKARHPEVPWRRVTAFRNVVVHEYFGLNKDILWDAVTREVPELAAQVRGILAEQ